MAPVTTNLSNSKYLSARRRHDCCRSPRAALNPGYACYAGQLRRRGQAHGGLRLWVRARDAALKIQLFNRLDGDKLHVDYGDGLRRA